MSRYFVTGATGFVGGELVKQLIGRGHQVVALVRSLDRARLLRALGVELHIGDITERETLREPMTGVDGVFHVAARCELGGLPAAIEQVNVVGTRHVLETMQELAIPKGVYASSLGVYGDTRGEVVDEHHRAHGPFFTAHDRSRWQALHDVALPLVDRGLPLVIGMPGLIYGPGDTSGVHATLVRLLRGRLRVIPTGSAFCWGYIEDTARGLIQAMDRGRTGEVYLLTGPVHSFDEALDIAARLTDKRTPLLHLGPTAMRAAAALARLLERLDVQLPYPSEALRLLAGTTCTGSSAKARRELGFEPRPLEEGLKPTIEHEMRGLGMA